MTTASSSSALHATALRGFTLVGVQTVTSKLISVATQFALSWLLLPEDFGLVGLAYTVSTVATACTQIGLREFIVRSRRCNSWVAPAAAAGLAISILGAFLMVAAAFFAASIYGEPRIVGLVLVLAAAAPFSTLNVVLSAVLQRRLQFLDLAILGVCSVLLSAILSLVFAWQGFGAYAFVAPVSLTAAAQCVVLWWLCGRHMRWRPRVRLWPHFLSTGSYVFLTGLLTTLGGQGDYILLGRFHAVAEVGLYFFAYSFAVQINRFLWGSFSGVLFPLLNSIKNDAPRLMAAFQRTVGTTAMLIVPLSVLQATLAEPIVRLFFAERWLAAVPMIQLMSVGIGLHAIAEPCVPLLQAQGRFRDLLRYTFVWLLLFLPCIYLAARFGSVTTVAAAVAIFYAVGSPIYFYAVIRKAGGSVRDAVVIYLPSACASLTAGAVSTWSGGILNFGPAWSLPVMTAVFVAVYVVLVARFSPTMWRNALATIKAKAVKTRSVEVG